MVLKVTWLVGFRSVHQPSPLSSHFVLSVLRSSHTPLPACHANTLQNPESSLSMCLPLG